MFSPAGPWSAFGRKPMSACDPLRTFHSASNHGAMNDVAPKKTVTARNALRPFSIFARPEVIFAMDGGGNGYGRVTYRYREVYVRLETEMGVATADVSLAPDFSRSWPLNVALPFLPQSYETHLTSAELGGILIAHYELIHNLLRTEEGQARLQESKSRVDAEHSVWVESLKEPAK